MSTELAHRSLVALTPQEMGPVQADLAAWCRAKILDLSHDLRDARQNMRQAKAMLWRWQGWQSVIRKTVARMIYFSKIQAAVKAGYLVVPNFPIEVIAVRVDREKPKHAVSAYPTDINTAAPDLKLPAGRGRYVDETLPHEDLSFTAHPNAQGKTELVRRARVGPAGYDETIDFPALLVKPVVLEATQRALALNIFDRVGVAFGDHATTTMSRRQRKADPIVIGQILDGSKAHPTDKPVSFFIAWWLDTRSL